MFVFLTDFGLDGHLHSSKTEELIEKMTKNIDATNKRKRVDETTKKLICIFYVNGFDSS